MGGSLDGVENENILVAVKLLVDETGIRTARRIWCLVDADNVDLTDARPRLDSIIDGQVSMVVRWMRQMLCVIMKLYQGKQLMFICTCI